MRYNYFQENISMIEQNSQDFRIYLNQTKNNKVSSRDESINIKYKAP